VLALGAAALLPGAQPISFKGSNMRFPDFFDPPNQAQLRTLVTGAEVVPDGANRYRIKNLHIETFRENGEPEGVVDATDCIYDDAARTASSGGPVKAHTADGRFRIEGTGFCVTLTNKSLTISNNVRTVIRDLGANTNKP
jgi:hypothetical protein